jgi:hypothetical protein
MVDALDYVLARRRGVAGGAPVVGCFGWWWPCSNTDAIECQITLMECARARGREGDRKEVAGSPGGVGIDNARWQWHGAPMSYLGGLVASHVLEKEGKRRGVWGIIIGTGYRQNG